MAKNNDKLLNLVDLLIGNILQNAIYTDLDTYKNHIKKLGSAYPVPQANVNDTRPLSFNGPMPEHPHKGKVGINAKNDVFPSSPSIHNDRPAFLDNRGPLRINGPDPIHPHDELTGINSSQHVFPYTHDNRPAFLNPVPPIR